MLGRPNFLYPRLLIRKKQKKPTIGLYPGQVLTSYACNFEPWPNHFRHPWRSLILLARFSAFSLSLPEPLSVKSSKETSKSIRNISKTAPNLHEAW